MSLWPAGTGRPWPRGASGGTGGAVGEDEVAVACPPSREPLPGRRGHDQRAPAGVPLVLQGDLDRPRVESQSLAQHLEGALLGRPDQVGQQVVVVGCVPPRRLLGRREVVGDEQSAAGLDQLEVAADAVDARRRRRTRPSRPGRSSRWRPPAGRAPMNASGAPSVALRITTSRRRGDVPGQVQCPGHGVLGRPAAETGLVAPFRVAHAVRVGRPRAGSASRRRRGRPSGRRRGTGRRARCQDRRSSSRAIPRSTASIRYGRSSRRSDDALERADLQGPLDAVDPVELVGHLAQLRGVDLVASARQLGPQLGSLGPVGVVTLRCSSSFSSGSSAVRRCTSRANTTAAAGAPPMTDARDPSSAATSMLSFSVVEKTTKAPPW